MGESTSDSRNSGTDGSIDLDELLASYIDRLTAGEMLDEESVLAEQPRFGAEIWAQLEAFHQIGTGGTVDPAGHVLGDYTLRAEIGRGGGGVVYDAWERSMDRRVALKVLPAGIAADTRSVTRFVREAQVSGKLSHPNIVSVFGMAVTEHTPCYAMEFVEGETLRRIIAGAAATTGPADAFVTAGTTDAGLQHFATVASAFAEVADGLQHAHSQSVVHRDIKPSNLILDSSGRLRILDFGLARLEGQETVTQSGDLVGTPLYMSPEQARRQRVPVDHRTDAYSLGATLYEVLTRRPPETASYYTMSHRS